MRLWCFPSLFFLDTLTGPSISLCDIWRIHWASLPAINCVYSQRVAPWSRGRNHCLHLCLQSPRPCSTLFSVSVNNLCNWTGRHATLLYNVSLFQSVHPKHAQECLNTTVCNPDLTLIGGVLDGCVFPTSNAPPFPEEPRRVEVKV